MTSKAIANPLAGVLAAAKKLPAVTGATASAERRAATGADTILILDLSGSMSECLIGSSRRRRVDVLTEALALSMSFLSSAERIVFSNLPRRLGLGESLPEPSGSTSLHLALRMAATLAPKHTIVVSDGEPDDRRAALAAAAVLAQVDAIYCGDDGNAEALAFMTALARAGRGRVIRRDYADGAPALAAALRQLALLPR